MYSQRVEKLLEKHSVKVGDVAKVKKGERVFEGIVMPRFDLGGVDSLVLKLANGYNVGVEVDSSVRIEKQKNHEPAVVEKEAAFELGKEKHAKQKLVFDKTKPHVSLIATGGTILSRVDYKTGGVTALSDPRDLLSRIPELADFVFIDSIKQPFSRMSENINSKDWAELAREDARELKTAQGVIVMHGTDTLHYTAAALSFMLQNLGKPVVLVGSQRSTDRPSSDAILNLICSSMLAGKGDFAGVGVCMHEGMSDNACLFLNGTKVRKLHSSRRDAFRPVNTLPLARVFPNGKIEKIDNNHARRSDSVAVADVLFEPRVALVKVFP